MLTEFAKSKREKTPLEQIADPRLLTVSPERMEERDLAKGNSNQQTRDRAQSRVTLQHALDRVRRAARRDRGLRFTTLWHHVYDVDRLREAYFSLKRDSAAGIDGETWQHYGEALEENLRALSNRLKRGAYRAKPVRRVYIPKSVNLQLVCAEPSIQGQPRFQGRFRATAVPAYRSSPQAEHCEHVARPRGGDIRRVRLRSACSRGDHLR